MIIEYDSNVDKETKELLEEMFSDSCKTDDAPNVCEVKTTDKKLEINTSGTALEFYYDKKRILMK